MIMGSLSARDILATQHVKRWHMIEVKRTQNIAEHSYLVALLAAKMSTLLTRPLSAQERVDLYEGALLHDVSEIEYGDIPTPTKRFLVERGLGFFIDMMEAMFWEKRGSLAVPTGTASQVVKHLVRLADLTEAASFYSKEGTDAEKRHRLRQDAWNYANTYFPHEQGVLDLVENFM